LNKEQILHNFYTTERLSVDMNDDGGLFGFDIHMALEVCYLIKEYNCDSVIETGTNMGDTTEFLAKCFPQINILSCENNYNFYENAKKRLNKYTNVTLYNLSSDNFIRHVSVGFPFYFLDAHWNDYWPLADEILNIHRGVVCVHDFDINSLKYNFDQYNNVKNDISFLKKHIGVNVDCYVNDPTTEYPYPLQQKKRLAGRAYYVLGKDNNPFKQCYNFKKHD